MYREMTLQTFTTLYNQERKRLYPYKHDVTFSIMKSKVTKKSVVTYEADQYGRPIEISRTPSISKQVVDTNGFTKLCQAVWEFYLNTDLKRISSEGKYRPGVGFIKNENRGFADLHGIFKGRSIYIEIKQTSENHLKSQKEFAEWVRSGGGIYVSVRSFEDIYEVVQCLINDLPLDKFMKIKQPKTRIDNRSLFE